MRRMFSSVLLAFLCPFPATAQWLDDFDAYPTGPLAGQGGWEEWNGGGASPNEVVNAGLGAAVRSAPNSIWVRGNGDSTYDWGKNQPGTYTAGLWTFCGHLYKPLTTTLFNMDVPSFWIMLNEYEPNTPSNWSVQVDFSPITGLFSVDTATTTMSGGPLGFDQWVEVRAEIDLDQDTVQLFYDGVSMGAPYPWNGGVSGFGSGSTEIDTLNLFANGALSPQSRVYWDDLSLLPGFDGCPADCPGAVSATYCTAGTSALGCQAVLTGLGDPSPTAGSGFTVTVDDVNGNTVGALFYGQNGRMALPWGNGTSWRCVVPPVKRLPLYATSGSSGTCEGGFSDDLNALWCATCPKPAKAPVVGQKLQMQFWYRDPLNTSNQTSGFSSALEADVCP